MATLPDTIEVQGEFELFAVSLPVFEGPFDLLLSLIARKKLDITEVALAQVTDESSPHEGVSLTCLVSRSSWWSPRLSST